VSTKDGKNPQITQIPQIIFLRHAVTKANLWNLWILWILWILFFSSAK